MNHSSAIIIQDRFFSEAAKLKNHFAERFSNPLKKNSERFVWDYWHVPNQYTLLQTPAYYFFPKPIYNQLHLALLDYGRKNLGCFNISPPWLSYYVDGCYQNFHADVPHGPWAYVYSLTDWRNKCFTGGETIISKPSTLNYWNHFLNHQGIEVNELFDQIEPLFNRLTVFDSRFPHGVNRVIGNQDPLKARIVIHGWFTQPEPYVIGGLNKKEATTVLNHWFKANSLLFESFSDIHGTLTFKLLIAKNGRCTKVQLLTQNIASLSPSHLPLKTLIKELKDSLTDITFLSKSKSSEVVLPLLFNHQV